MNMRLPEQNIEAEQSLISSLLQNNNLFDDCEFLRSEEFYQTDHQLYFRLMSELSRKKINVDLITLGEALKKEKELTEDRVIYLRRIIDNAPAFNTKQYVKIIQDCALTRAVKERAMNILDSDLHGEDLLSNAQSKILNIQSSAREDDIKAVKDIILDHIERIERANAVEEMAGYKIGFPNIDKNLRLRDGKLIVIAARPGMGKTSFAVTAARNLDRHGTKVGFLSIEMPENEIMDRWLSMESDVDLKKIGQYRGLSNLEIRDINDAASVLYESELKIDASGSLDISDVERKSRKLKKDGVQVLFIDQLNQIKNRDVKSGKATERTTENIMRLSCLKKELGIPICILHQINRDMKMRSDKMPIISDLKDSGRVEEDADAIIFIHRPEEYASDEEKKFIKGDTIVQIAKNRQGPKYTDKKIKFKHETTYFYQGMM